MTGIGEKSYEAPVAEDGGRDGDVVELGGGLPRIVGDEHVSRMQALRRERLEKMPHPGRHGVDVAGRSRDGLRDHAASTVEDAGGEISRFAHDRSKRRPHERRGLLVHDTHQSVP